MSDDAQNPHLSEQATNTPAAESTVESSGEISGKRVVGKPYPKGTSGNPGGKKKRQEPSEEAMVLRGECSTEAMQQALVLLRAGRTPALVKFKLIKLFIEQEFGVAPHLVRQLVDDNRQPPPGTTVNVNVVGNGGSMALSPAQARALLRRPLGVPAEQIQAAEAVVYGEAERAAAALLPSPATKPAIESTVENEDERPNNVVQLGVRIDQEEAQ